MKKLLLFLVVFLATIAQASVSVTGHVDGTSLANLNNGTLIFTLNGCSGPATITIGGAPVPSPVVLNLDSSGNVAGSIVGTNEITCTGTPYYSVTASNSLGSQVWTRFYQPTTGSFTPTLFNAMTVLPPVVSPVATSVVTASNALGTGIISLKDVTGASIGDRIDAACALLSGAPGVVIIPPNIATGWSIINPVNNCNIIDYRGTGGAAVNPAFVNGVNFYSRYTSVGSGLKLVSPMMIQVEAFSGGHNDINTTKTQWQALRVEVLNRTIGETKGSELNVSGYGGGDVIGLMASAYCWNGYNTGGDEGCIGGRFMATSGDPGVADGNYPRGTVTTIAGNVLTGSWTGGSNGNLGEVRPIINTSRGVYSVGTIASSNGSVPCVITGAGTSWLTLAPGGVAGDVSDLFLEVVAYSNGNGAKWVAPITHVTDNTHLILEYSLAELGPTCLASSVSGSYNIFRGGKVATLVSPSSAYAPVAANLAAGGADFQVGDIIQQPMSYNYHPTGVTSIVGRLLGGSNLGSGVVSNNIFPAETQNSYRGIGNWQNGISFDNGTISQAGVHFNGPTGSLVRMEDASASLQSIVLVFHSSPSTGARNIYYDRTNDVWSLGPFNVNALDGRIAQVALPQPNTANYLFYNDATWSGLIVAPNAVPNIGVPIFDTQVQGVSRLRVENTKVIFNNGMDVFGYSANLATQKWGVTGSTGAGRFDGGVVGSTINATTGFQVNGIALSSANLSDGPFVATGSNVTFTGTDTFNNTLTLKGTTNALSIAPTSLAGILHFAAAGATAGKTYDIMEGVVANFDGHLRFVENSTAILDYIGTSTNGWQFQNARDVTGWSDAGSTMQWKLNSTNGNFSTNGQIVFTGGLLSGPLLSSADLTSGSQIVMQFLSTGAGARNFTVYDRANDNWIDGTFQTHGSDQRASVGGTVPQANIGLYIGNTTTTWDTVVIGAPTSLNPANAALDVKVGSFSVIRTEATKFIVNNATDVIGYSANLTAQKWGVTGSIGQGRFDGGVRSGINVVSFSTTPTFDATLGNTQKITLTASVTSSTMTIPPAGQTVNFLICQNGTGGWTFVWPTGFKGVMTIGTTLSTCSAQSFVSDGTNVYATSPGLTNQ